MTTHTACRVVEPRADAADAADAAGLRAAFKAAVESYPRHILMPPEFQAWWAKFYVAICDHTDGLKKET